MKARAIAAALVLAGLCAGCVGATQTGCNGVYRGCTPFEQHCEDGWVRCGADASGATEEIVHIHSRPTSAAIYIDGRFAGYSPLSYRMRFTSKTNRISLAAVPIYGDQAQQTREIVVPPLPRRVLFLMNNAARSSSNAEPAAAPGASGAGDD
ncbi:MAG: hypothetical protein K9M02_14000 [Thiohalocapsa sp.]|nr:hypothetical protein [Thiohalocapsa sp.]